MVYGLMGRAHAALLAASARERGQGTVEYVALILLVAVVLAGVIAATRRSSIGAAAIGETILRKLKAALDGVR